MRLIGLRQGATIDLGGNINRMFQLTLLFLFLQVYNTSHNKAQSGTKKLFYLNIVEETKAV